MSKSSPPPAPDYTGAAVATASGNRDAAIASQQGSLVNQNTPYGSLNYSQRGTTAQGNPTYQADYNLSPVGQQLLNYGNQSALGLGALQNTATQNVASTMGQPVNNSNVPALQNNFNGQTASQGSDVAYKAATARLDPQWQQNTEMNRTQLANQGIMPGSEAYDNEMRVFNQGKNDAYSQAQANALSQGLSEASLNNQTGFNQANLNNATAAQQLQQNVSLYNQPLNALNALRSSSQVTNPQFSAQPGMQYTGGPNYAGAAQNQAAGALNGYNSQVGQQNSFTNGLYSLGGAALTGLAFSDKNLKSKIRRIGTHPLGIRIYSYEIFGKPEIGVMAQEVLQVRPEAVIKHPSGYLMVNYGGLNA